MGVKKSPTYSDQAEWKTQYHNKPLLGVELTECSDADLGRKIAIFILVWNEKIVHLLAWMNKEMTNFLLSENEEHKDKIGLQ